MNIPMDDDAALLHAYAEHGSAPAFTTLVERHADLVYSAALRRMAGDPHRAREVTQMVFIDLARKAARLRHHPVLVAWLHQSTRWAATTLLRSERRRAHHERKAAHDDATAHLAPLTHPAAAAASVAEPDVDWDHLRPLLDAALDTLREADREAVLLRFFAQQPFAAIAAQLGLSENAARMRVDRALDRLARVLRRRGITSTATALATALSAHAVTPAPVGLAMSLATASLGAAAVVTTAGFSVTTFLMSKLTLGLAAAAALVCVVGYKRQLDARHSAHTTLVAAQAAAREAEATLAPVASRRQAQQAAVSALSAVPDPTAAQLERRRLDVIVRKGELDNDNLPLFQALRLDPVRLDALRTLLVDRYQAIYDALQLGKEYDLPTENLTRDERARIEREAARPFDQQIAALLGPDRAAVYQRFQDTLPIRRLLSSLMDYETGVLGESEPRLQALISLFEPHARDYFATADKATGPDNPPLPLPPEFIAQALSVMTPNEQQRLAEDWNDLTHAAWRRMNEIARAAAYAGKLKLTEKSARLYGPPTPTKSGAPAVALP